MVRYHMEKVIVCFSVLHQVCKVYVSRLTLRWIPFEVILGELLQYPLCK